MRNGRFVRGDRVEVGGKLAGRHAARVGDARRAVEPEAQAVEMYQDAAVALGIGAARRPSRASMSLVADEAAGDIGFGGEMLRLETPAR